MVSGCFLCLKLLARYSTSPRSYFISSPGTIRQTTNGQACCLWHQSIVQITCSLACGSTLNFQVTCSLATPLNCELVAASHRPHKNVYRRAHKAPQFLMLSAEKEGKGQCPAWRNAHLLYSLRHQTRWLVTALSFSLLCRMQISWLLNYLSFGRGVAALRCSAGTLLR